MSKLIKLEQPSCNPCKMVSQYLDDKEIKYDVYDVTQQPEIASEYGVMSVPVTILLDSDGNEVQRSIGFNPPELDEMISKLG